MFFPGTDPSQEPSAVVLVPTRFVWPYGGQRIFVTGTFTRWSEHVPMSPVEGCPNVFQAICGVSPGFHQYKFYVDGEWRHDEHQPCVTGNYGIVNTLLLTRDPDPIPPISSPVIPGNRTTVEVDNEAFWHVVAPLRISEADVEISRHHISVFLSTHTSYELLPESGKVIALDVNLPVKQAFHILYEQGIPVAPLWDSFKGQFVGVLSPTDFILILREAGPYDSLKELAIKILQNDVATVPIIHSSSQDGSFPQLLHLATLSGILKCICRHFRYSSGSLPILQQPICTIPLGTWVPRIGEANGRPLAMLRPNASLGSALALLIQARVSSIPIVDDNDSLLDTYSKSDITALAKDRAYAQICLDEMSIQQSLQLRQDANSPYGFYEGQRCQMCLHSDPLLKVIERLANPGVRRLIIVEAGSKRVEGIISLSDVFRFLLG